MERNTFYLSMVGIVLLSFGFASCMENNIIISKGYVAKLCSDRCRQQSETIVVDDCERGCRFFDLAESSELVDFNETAFHIFCLGNCREAYLVEKNRISCDSGCDAAKKEIDNIMEMSHHLIEEAEKQMNFLNSVIGMFSSAFWSEDENAPKDTQIGNGQLLDLFGDIPTRGNRLDNKISASDVEIINMLGDEMSAVDPAETTYCATRLWLHRLSFILIVMGSLSLLFISIFYLLAFMKHKKSKIVEETSTGDLTNGNPPSYDQLIKSGYIVVADNYMTPLYDEKKEKVFVA